MDMSSSIILSSSSADVDSVVSIFNSMAYESFRGGFVLAITLMGIVAGLYLVVTGISRAVGSH